MKNTLLVASTKKNEKLSRVVGHLEQVELDLKNKDRDIHRRFKRKDNAKCVILEEKDKEHLRKIESHRLKSLDVAENQDREKYIS